MTTTGEPTPPPGGDPQQTPPAGPPTTTQIPPSEPQAGDEQISLEEARKLRSEAKNLRDRLKASEAKAKEFDDLKARIEQENLTENQKLQKQVAELQAKYDAEAEAAFQQVAINEVYKSAMRLNFVDPDAAVRLIDWEDIDVDDNGHFTNIDTVLTNLLKAKPYLQANTQNRTQASSGGATNPSRSHTSAVTAQSVLAMMKAGQPFGNEYNQLSTEQKAELQKLMRAR